MENGALLQSVAALVFVLCLIGVISVLLRRYGSGRIVSEGANTGKRRLGVVEVHGIDARRKLVLVRRDDQEHLLLIAPDREMVIESVGLETKEPIQMVAKKVKKKKRGAEA